MQSKFECSEAEKNIQFEYLEDLRYLAVSSLSHLLDKE